LEEQNSPAPPTERGLPEAPALKPRREYPNPPIVEAIVQFTFAEATKWNVATPGRLYEALKDSYPSEPEMQGVLQASFTPQPGIGVAPDFTLSQGGQRVLYKDESKTRLLVINPQTFSVNSVRPYEGWKLLRPRMLSAIETICEVLELSPVSEVSIRYINQFSLPRGQPTEEFLNYHIDTAQGGASYVNNFVIHVESILADGVTLAATTLATSQPQTETSFPIVLDLDFKRQLSLMPIREALDQVEELKALENSEFESAITDRTRELFL
jgi:uncharacterized protein (TIGR04255 family)